MPYLPGGNKIRLVRRYKKLLSALSQVLASLPAPSLPLELLPWQRHLIVKPGPRIFPHGFYRPALAFPAAEG